MNFINIRVNKIFRKRLVVAVGSLLIIGTAALNFVRPVLANLLGLSAHQIEDFTNVNLQSMTINGYQQIYFMEGQQRTILTSGRLNHTNPAGRGKFVVWQTEVNGAPQVELYDVANDRRIPLTRTGTNQNPKVDIYGNVVWEQWEKDRWQIMLYDGTSSNQLTQGDTSVRPDINGNHIVYASQASSGKWFTKKYHIDSKVTEIINEGDEAAYPYFQETEIMYGFH